jgi:hypothetical protein
VVAVHKRRGLARTLEAAEALADALHALAVAVALLGAGLKGGLTTERGRRKEFSPKNGGSPPLNPPSAMNTHLK